jgi:hypothetical protein
MTALALFAVMPACSGSEAINLFPPEGLSGPSGPEQTSPTPQGSEPGDTTDGGSAPTPDDDAGVAVDTGRGGTGITGGGGSGAATTGGAAGTNGAAGMGGAAGTAGASGAGGTATGGTAGSPNDDAGTSPSPSAAALLHRYSFSEPGIVAFDSVEEANGTLEGGTTIPATGDIVFDGVDDYVQLPEGLISPLHDATFMLWGTWNGSTFWQRFWDFGNTLTTPEMRVEADRTFFLTPQQDAEYDGPASFLEFRGPLGGMEFGHEYLIASSSTALEPNVGHVFTVVVDEAALTMSLYVDAALIDSRSLIVKDSGVPFLLSDIDDTNNLLGRSQYAVDPYLEAEINEFRIYGRALTAVEVAAAFTAGADANPVP